MTALLSVLGTALLFVIFGRVARRGCGECDACRSCGWWKEKDHGS